VAISSPSRETRELHSSVLRLWLHEGRDTERETAGVRTFVVANSQSPSGEERAVRSYRITLRCRETQTVVGYYDGSWTTDRRRALDLRKREVAEVHAARMRERCPRNADLIKVEELLRFKRRRHGP